MKGLEFRSENLNLLERRDKSIRESIQKIETLHKKASELGLIKTYVDHLGRLQIQIKK